MGQKTYPEPTVAALIFNKEGKALFILSPKWLDKYALPGGHVELGETLEQALKREVKEEVNLEIFDISFLNLQEFVFGDEFYKKKHFIFIDYFCRTNSDKVTLDGREGTEYVWVLPDEALKLSLNPYTKNTILEYKKRYLS